MRIHARSKDHFPVIQCSIIVAGWVGVLMKCRDFGKFSNSAAPTDNCVALLSQTHSSSINPKHCTAASISLHAHTPPHSHMLTFCQFSHTPIHIRTIKPHHNTRLIHACKSTQRNKKHGLITTKTNLSLFSE